MGAGQVVQMRWALISVVLRGPEDVEQCCPTRLPTDGNGLYLHCPSW